MVKRVTALVAVALVTVGCSKTAVPEGCPEHLRFASIPEIPDSKDPTDFKANEEEKIRDCLIEHAGMLAQGKSSDEDVAKSAVAYCGVYGETWDDDAQRASDKERTEREALNYVVTSRALRCPPPRHRTLVGTKNVIPECNGVFC